MRKALWLYCLSIAAPLIFALVIYSTLRQAPPRFIYEFMIWSSLPITRLAPEFDWFVYNLPDGLWAYSLTSFIILASKDDSKYVKFAYLIFGIGLMLALEIFQGSLLPGTFDPKDVLSIILGYVLSILILQMYRRT